MSVSDRFRRWFDYEKDVHALVITSLATVPEDRRADASYQKALDLLGHIAAARSLWLFRFGEAESGPATTADLFPRGSTLAEVEAGLASMHASWTEFLSRVDDDKLHELFEYRATEGTRFRNRIEDLLAQLYGHSWYHRGQIAAIVRSLGGEPAATDFVFWSRESID